jgi:hypothetical protein
MGRKVADEDGAKVLSILIGVLAHARILAQGADFLDFFYVVWQDAEIAALLVVRTL